MLIAFDLWGDYAHFSHPATIYSSLTYPVPPKTAIMGLLGAIIGLKEYEKLGDLKYSVKLNASLKKKTMIFNGIKMALSSSMKLADGYQDASQKKQFYRELICEPNYTIYLNLENLDKYFQDQIYKNIKEHKSVYTPYLGINFCLADFKFKEIKNFNKIEDEKIYVSSFVLENDFIFEKDNFSAKLSSYTMPCDVENNRIFKEFKNFIIEINLGKLLAKNSGEIYEINDERLYFV
ncbi:CRISPR-associated protein Cas5 [Campylobacter sp. RM12327]|uniref:CRISPR-associated protein Cas5 n=1 Tax=Campylobacter sputorum TaxID=206 RepID=UPI000B777F44|nr:MULTISPECIES: CRISPR-associated protein Cas5 [Campylobacter]MBE7358746.1 CRISPR-associated protein Cas5 [Campylobacter sp. RM11302]MBF6670070.1 CRISPR-associated protein Cas5 [Campylobacter sp. RM12327]MBF6675198.1 CRISPR-associated protein Cas5 [Campylobacter sp. RM13538]MBF6676810.1 CRISPR-associated protein Cas5 [Campylobacter sp. RM12321]MBF6678544.1 CRISPR-associated protein Cas5 [Campylobacter sp. RM11259]